VVALVPEGYALRIAGSSLVATRDGWPPLLLGASGWRALVFLDGDQLASLPYVRAVDPLAPPPGLAGGTSK